ncbi:MAG: DUF488 domain-containing protein [Candidatus Azambacteria bacterium]|nr:DUF488 domain-containing protein [Candidatus Azambacteria bacterium]
MEKELFTKSIVKEKEPNEKRISVMSRHTKEDGITPDERIVEGVTFDEWRKEFAPPGKLVGAYYRNEISWEDFARRYIEFLQSPEVKPKVESFAKRCTEETITLMCIEDTADKCHRRLLAEELQKYQPQLKIFHK